MKGARAEAAAEISLESPRELLRQVELTAWELDPRAGAALGQIGAEATVVLTDAAATARISRVGESYRIEVSPTFVKEHVRSPRDLLFVLLHEIRHKVQGDLLRPGDDDKVSQLVANIVADVRINGDLCREFFPEGVPLLDRLYAQLSVPSILLLPPHRLLALFGRERGVPEARGCATIGAVDPEGPIRDIASQVFLEAGVDSTKVADLGDWYARAWLYPASHEYLYKNAPQAHYRGVGRSLPWKPRSGKRARWEATRAQTRCGFRRDRPRGHAPARGSRQSHGRLPPPGESRARAR